MADEFSSTELSDSGLADAVSAPVSSDTGSDSGGGSDNGSTSTASTQQRIGFGNFRTGFDATMARRRAARRARAQQRGEAVEELDEQFEDVDITEGDIQRTENRFELTPDARKRVIVQRGPILAFSGDGAPAGLSGDIVDRSREIRAARDLDEANEGVDVEPEDVSATDTGLELNEETERGIAATQLDGQVDGVQIGQGDLRRTDQGFTVTESVERELAAADLDAELPSVDIGPEDVVKTNDGFSVSSEIEEELTTDVQVRQADLPTLQPPVRESRPVGQNVTPFADAPRLPRETVANPVAASQARGAGAAEAQREVAADIERELAQQELAEGAAPEVQTAVRQQLDQEDADAYSPIDVEPGDDVRVTFEDGGLSIDISGDVQAKRVEQAAAEQLGERLGRQRARRIAGPEIATIAAMDDDTSFDDFVTPVDVEPGEDVVAQYVGSEIQVEISDEFQQEQLAKRFNEQTVADLERGEDFEITEQPTPPNSLLVSKFGIDPPDFRAQLTPTGREELITRRAEVRGQLGDIEIEDVDDQLVFNEQGRLTNIEKPPTAAEPAINFVGDVAGGIQSTIDPVTTGAVRGLSAAETAISRRTPADRFASGVVDAGGSVGASPTPITDSLRDFGGGVAELSSAAVDEVTEQPIGDVVATRLAEYGEFAVRPDRAVLGRVESIRSGNPAGIIGPQSDIGQTANQALSGPASSIPVIDKPLPETAGQGFATTAEFFVRPDAAIGGRLPPDGLGDFSRPQSQTGEAIETFTTAGSEAATQFTLGAPAEIARAGATAEEVATTAAEEIDEEGLVEGSASLTSTAAVIGGVAAAKLTEETVRNPAKTGGAILGSSVVGTAVSPLRVGKLTLPTESGTATLRGVRLTAPRVLQGRVDRPGVTIAGTVNGRPTLGTPSIRPERIDFEEAGERTRAFEPISRFETDVTRQLANQAGPEAAARFAAVENLVSQGARADPELEISETESIVREAEDVPEGAAPEISDALQDLDATIKGSAAIRAQVPEARTPRDVDIIVGDEAGAIRRLDEALEGFDEDPTDVFDIATRAEAGQPGEIAKFGRLARERLQTDEGVGVRPASEELIRKAGASGFIRGQGTPAEEFPGRTSETDVGPEPVAEGAFPRVKDAGDAGVISAALAEPGTLATLSPLGRVRARRRAREIVEFREEFEPEVERATARQQPVTTPARARDVLRLPEFASAERGQFTPVRASRQSDSETRIPEDNERVREGQGESPSPRDDRRGGFGRTPPIPGSTSPAGVDDTDSTTVSAVDVDSAPPAEERTESGTSSAAASGGSGTTASSPSPVGNTSDDDFLSPISTPPGEAPSPVTGIEPTSFTTGGGSDDTKTPTSTITTDTPGTETPTIGVPTLITGGGGGKTIRARKPEFEEDEEEKEPLFGGERKGIFTSFLDPLSGDVLETPVDDIDPELDQPALLGFEPSENE